MSVLLIPNRGKDAGLSVTRHTAVLLRRQGLSVLMADEFAGDFTPLDGITFLPLDRAVNAAKQVLTIGGDGTLLRAGIFCAEHDRPVLGINLGRTGFLATCEVAELDSKIARLSAGDYTLTARSLLEASVPSRNWRAVAMNDVVLFGRTRIHPMDYKLICDGTFVSRYRSDGLIAATPTGSTDYSFSAGGPVLDACAPVMVLTPVCAHSVHAVPVVFGADRHITIVAEQENRDTVYACADSGPQCELAPGESLHITTSPKKVQLITFDPAEQLSAIESKLIRR